MLGLLVTVLQVLVFDCYHQPGLWFSRRQLESEGIAAHVTLIYRSVCDDTSNCMLQQDLFAVPLTQYAQLERGSYGTLQSQNDLLCSFVQAQAAAQAGVSVIQPNVGRIMDWYKKHPGYIKNQKVSLQFCSSNILASVGHSPASTVGQAQSGFHCRLHQASLFAVKL